MLRDSRDKSSQTFIASGGFLTFTPLFENAYEISIQIFYSRYFETFILTLIVKIPNFIRKKRNVQIKVHLHNDPSVKLLDPKIILLLKRLKLS